jgi:hypothetical protein
MRRQGFPHLRSAERWEIALHHCGLRPEVRRHQMGMAIDDHSVSLAGVRPGYQIAEFDAFSGTC